MKLQANTVFDLINQIAQDWAYFDGFIRVVSDGREYEVIDMDMMNSLNVVDDLLEEAISNFDMHLAKSGCYSISMVLSLHFHGQGENTEPYYQIDRFEIKEFVDKELMVDSDD